MLYAMKGIDVMAKRAGVTLTPEAHQALRALAALASGVTERPVSMSEALTAILPVARQHPEELRAQLDRTE
jgi:hypothetical protein